MITYEWVIETLAYDPDGPTDIIDVRYEDTYKAAVAMAERCKAAGEVVQIGLVRDNHNKIDEDLEDRTWAYIDEKGRLPETFENGVKVPPRFHKEVGQ